MKSAVFGAFLKAQREKKGVPQRIVAHAVDVDTSTLSKMELGERPIYIAMIKPWVESLNLDFKKVQIEYISEKIVTDFNGQPHLLDALEIVKARLTI